jgi:O-antigen/teichoic acid export membrane protein
MCSTLNHSLGQAPASSQLSLRKLLSGSASNLVRVLLSVVVAITLPPLLVRHLSQAEYSAWVLILQLSAYIALLDLGLQAVISKSIAEYHANGDHEAKHRLLSSSVSMLCLISIVGLAAAVVLTWRVPQLFHQMPPVLIPRVRISLLLIGCSAAFALPFNPFLSVFTGLQEYGFPTAVALLSKIGSTLLLMAMVLLGKSLVQMAIALTVVSMATALAQWGGWRRYARARVAFSAFSMPGPMVKNLLRSGGPLAIWTVGGLFVSGLDVVIVGHYDYANTGFYSIGAGATNFMLMCVTGLFSPLLPAVSAMQTTSKPKEIGDLTIRTSRFCTVILCALAVPLTIGAYPVLCLWVGHTYALRSVRFLQILVLGNLVRLLGYPYAIFTIATGQQHLSATAAVAEALVNLLLSIWLVQRVGAIGVAYGTLIGAFVSIGLHLAVSMRFTRRWIELSRLRFIMDSLLRPLVCTLPVLLLLPFMKWNSLLPAPVSLLSICAVMIGSLFLLFGITGADQSSIQARLSNMRKASGRNS